VGRVGLYSTGLERSLESAVTVYIVSELTNWLQISCVKFEANAQTLGNVHYTKFTICFWVQVNQYSKTNMMHFLFSLLRITGLYMFQALLTDLQGMLQHARNIPSVICAAFPKDQ
jgi:hypothetical protein